MLSLTAQENVALILFVCVALEQTLVGTTFTAIYCTVLSAFGHEQARMTSTVMTTRSSLPQRKREASA
ncbi:unnamed protein product [Peronospora belbahrii]|uniref:Uncharacterized protein n=1 Tax=Peronospora belbahrii TaxID=622444 RepID=A0ABN8DB96_9STRA|nr:unnamed protein product [Peronospora belbahrii]